MLLLLLYLKKETHSHTYTYECFSLNTLGLRFCCSTNMQRESDIAMAADTGLRMMPYRIALPSYGSDLLNAVK